MSRISDQLLATKLASWFHKKGCGAVTIHETGGMFYVYYTLKRDVKPQPPVTILHSVVLFPRGSQPSVVNAYLKEGLR